MLFRSSVPWRGSSSKTVAPTARSPHAGLEEQHPRDESGENEQPVRQPAVGKGPLRAGDVALLEFDYPRDGEDGRRNDPQRIDAGQKDPRETTLAAHCSPQVSREEEAEASPRARSTGRYLHSLMPEIKRYHLWHDADHTPHGLCILLIGIRHDVSNKTKALVVARIVGRAVSWGVSRTNNTPKCKSASKRYGVMTNP